MTSLNDTRNFYHHFLQKKVIWKLVPGSLSGDFDIF